MKLKGRPEHVLLPVIPISEPASVVKDSQSSR